MSFAATARRARDTTQPFGRRVSYLHACLESFNLFGYHATRAKLRAVVGAIGPGWTERQMLDALDLLEPAQRSWSAFLTNEMARRRAFKRLDWNAYRGVRFGGAFQAWLEEYLDSGHASDWDVAAAGDCSECGHRLIHHGSSRCRACTWDFVWEPTIPIDQIPPDPRCKVPLLEIRPD
jgi:hypothetical protein